MNLFDKVARDPAVNSSEVDSDIVVSGPEDNVKPIPAKTWRPPTVTSLAQIEVAGGDTSNQLENSSGLLGS